MKARDMSDSSLPEVEKKALPSFDDLVDLYETIQAAELAEYGKTSITQLHTPRRAEMQLMDSIIYYLHNREVLQESSSVHAMDDKNLEKYNRDVLAGVMFFVCNDIYNTYYLRSPQNSYVYSALKEGLAAFDAELQKRAVITFVNYYRINNIPDIDGPKSLKNVYTLTALMKAVPNEVALELCPKATAQQGSAQPVADQRSFFNWLTFGIFGTTVTSTSTAPAVTAEEEQRVKPTI